MAFRYLKSKSDIIEVSLVTEVFGDSASMNHLKIEVNKNKYTYEELKKFFSSDVSELEFGNSVEQAPAEYMANNMEVPISIFKGFGSDVVFCTEGANYVILLYYMSDEYITEKETEADLLNLSVSLCSLYEEKFMKEGE